MHHVHTQTFEPASAQPSVRKLHLDSMLIGTSLGSDTIITHMQEAGLPLRLIHYAADRMADWLADNQTPLDPEMSALLDEGARFDEEHGSDEHKWPVEARVRSEQIEQAYRATHTRIKAFLLQDWGLEDLAIVMLNAPRLYEAITNDSAGFKEIWL